IRHESAPSGAATTRETTYSIRTGESRAIFGSPLPLSAWRFAAAGHVLTCDERETPALLLTTTTLSGGSLRGVLHVRSGRYAPRHGPATGAAHGTRSRGRFPSCSHSRPQAAGRVLPRHELRTGPAPGRARSCPEDRRHRGRAALAPGLAVL